MSNSPSRSAAETLGPNEQLKILPVEVVVTSWFGCNEPLFQFKPPYLLSKNWRYNKVTNEPVVSRSVVLSSIK